MALPLPARLSSNPDVNSSAMAWAAQLVDLLSSSGNASGKKYGKVTLTFTASDNATLAVTHGLGAAPTAVIATSTHQNVIASVTATSSTTFTLSGEQKDGIAFSGSIDVYWLALA